MRVLLDCDGVVADWTGAVANVIREETGTEMDITKWFRQGDLPDGSKNRVMSRIAGSGFCRTLDLLPGAKEGVDELRVLGHDVHFVTSLWDAPTWVYDRNAWLRAYRFAKAPGGVTYTKEKWRVAGDVFVDDKPANVEAWQDAWPNGSGMLFDQPWNQHASGMRLCGWTDLLAFVKWRSGNG